MLVSWSFLVIERPWFLKRNSGCENFAWRSVRYSLVAYNLITVVC